MVTAGIPMVALPSRRHCTPDSRATDVRAQTPVDSALLAYINSIRAIDVHAHPDATGAAGRAGRYRFRRAAARWDPAVRGPTSSQSSMIPSGDVAQDALFHTPGATSDSTYHTGLSAPPSR